MNQMSHRYNYTVYKNALLLWLVARRKYATSSLEGRVKAKDGWEEKETQQRS